MPSGVVSPQVPLTQTGLLTAHEGQLAETPLLQLAAVDEAALDEALEDDVLDDERLDEDPLEAVLDIELDDSEIKLDEDMLEAELVGEDCVSFEDEIFELDDAAVLATISMPPPQAESNVIAIEQRNAFFMCNYPCMAQLN